MKYICPICGSAARPHMLLDGVSFYCSNYSKCGAAVSFEGKKYEEQPTLAMQKFGARFGVSDKPYRVYTQRGDDYVLEAQKVVNADDA